VLHADQAPIRAARFEQEGTLRTGPRSWRWMRFAATQTVSPPEVRFDWDARISLAPLLHLRVRDSLCDGVGGGRVDLCSAIPLGAQSGVPELNAGALHRYLAEAVWYPTALRPGGSVAWSPIDERRALATIESHGVSVSLEFRFTTDDLVASIYTPQRWAKVGRRYVQMAWEGRFFGYWECSGMLIPSAGEVGWYTNGQWDAVWKGRVTYASYELDAEARFQPASTIPAPAT
jgi:hypothetical protein